MADPDSRLGIRYAGPQILEFLDDTHHAHNSPLAKAFEAPEKRGIPPIQVSRADGATLSLLLRLCQARRVVEIGTLAGYSALCMARALPAQGHVWTLESEPAHVEIARANLAIAGESARITVVQGDAIDRLRSLEAHGPFCAVFLDADKERYDQYARWAIDHLRPGGVLIGDNAYFFGRLLDDDPDALAMRRFHKLVADNMESVCIGTPDGMVVGIQPGPASDRDDALA